MNVENKRFTDYKNLIWAEVIEENEDLTFSHIKAIVEDTTLQIFYEAVGERFFSYPPSYWAEQIKYI